MTVINFKPQSDIKSEQSEINNVEKSLENLVNKNEISPKIENEQLLGRVLAEFDGTTVLCRVCGDKASGFHYGVHSCEGCKGFFRRSIQQKIQYRPCTKNQQCSILRINRNRCQYCRLKKCIAVGMSRDAVRFGRVPKREKARILAAMQQSTNSRSHEKSLAAELEDDQRLLTTVVRAHLETCDFTRDKVEPMLLQARTRPSFTACPPTLACPLNPNPQPLTGQQELLQDFSKRFSPAIRGVVEFAKRITGFAVLPQDDQVTLLKAGVFEVLLVRLACMFDGQNNSMICLNGQVLKRDSIHNSSNARFLMDSMFDFAERLNSLRLSDAEIGLFSSVVVIAPDRPGLRNVELIEKMHNKLKALLQVVLNQNHPNRPNLCIELIKKIPDLRTLNTLHSEKLLAFKMTEQQQLQQLTHQNEWANMKFKAEDFKSEERDMKSPVGSSSWSSSSEGAMEEVKSPMGSVSSTESACSGEIASLNDSGIHATNAPLLAATLASGVCPVRHRDNSGSMSGEDDVTNHSTPITNKQPLVNNYRSFRKLDSPSDSGIESGTEKIEKMSGSAPTSICSSPRSSLEDKDDHNHNRNSSNGNNSSIEDMPVLKRVLQAPPLYDTNSLMDEAYKPHKKFRALRNKDAAEAEPVIPSTSHSSQLQYHLTTSSLSSTHSTLAKSLMEGPRMTPEQMKRTDIIHNFIMRGVDGQEGQSCPYSAQVKWEPRVETSVIATSGRPAMQSPARTPLNSPGRSGIQSPNRSHVQSPYLMNGRVSSPPAMESRIYHRVHNVSPSCLSNSSPPHFMHSPSSSPGLISPSYVNLQVGITNAQQPLNLSKKTPPSSPLTLSSSSTAVPSIVSMEA